MRTVLYLKLAAGNIKKNHRLYLPNIFAGMGLVGMFYIILTLRMDNRLNQIKGGSFVTVIMPMGAFIVGVLSVILILYTNSFLMKQRKREFGLYNVLGMEKRHVGKILFWESLLSAMSAILGGLLLGILLYKLFSLIICRLMAVNSILGFYHISPKTLVPTALFFGGLYLAAFLINRIQIGSMKPVQLLQSTHVGEKEPKIKILMLVVGLLTLGGGYYLALVTKDPMGVVNFFLLAVLLVIAGTYFLCTTGSIAVLKALKKNKKYYYRKRHMVAVSGLLYRMKQNAVGIASIAIMATMVLIMISTTVCMYAGIEDSLSSSYSHDLYYRAFYSTPGDEEEEPEFHTVGDDVLEEIIGDIVLKEQIPLAYTGVFSYLSCSFGIDGNTLSMDTSNESLIPSTFWFMTEEEYERVTGESVSLGEHEFAYYASSNNNEKLPQKLILQDETYVLTEKIKVFPVSMAEYTITDCYGIVVPGAEDFEFIDQAQKEGYGELCSHVNTCAAIDFEGSEKEQEEYADRLVAKLQEEMGDYLLDLNVKDIYFSWDNVWEQRTTYYGMFGSLLFLGFILTFVFTFATALVIYYKQISEGYDDRERFQIMQKVGMSEAEVKAIIRTQILLVFFLPLVIAAVHVLVAFPMLVRLMRILFSANTITFFLCVVAVFLIFSVIYVIIYSLTAREYYRIVR